MGLADVCMSLVTKLKKKQVFNPVSQRILWISHPLRKEVEAAKSQLDG